MNIKNYKEWYNMKRAILKGLHCVLCNDEHPTLLHHCKRIDDYPTPYDYWNDETQVPVCIHCHGSKLHIMSEGKLNKQTGLKWCKCMGSGFD